MTVTAVVRRELVSFMIREHYIPVCQPYGTLGAIRVLRTAPRRAMTAR